MFNELMDFLSELEWQGSKPDPVQSFCNWVCYFLMMGAAGYMAGQAICIIFDIGVVGHEWRNSIEFPAHPAQAEW